MAASLSLSPHSILGVREGASPEEVKAAYRRLARILHPDASGGGTEGLFLAVQDAYEKITATETSSFMPTVFPRV